MRLMFIELLWPDKQAPNFQLPRSIKGAMNSPQTRPPVDEMNEPSDDQLSRRLIDMLMLYLKYLVISVSSVRLRKF